ncbi:hypothetical protein N9487_01025 [Cyclobacteriaceae bacterium]|nr:hypothetical protein [Cyclobacteriaceae bacterium]
MFLFSIDEIKIPFGLYLLFLVCSVSSIFLLVDINSFGFVAMSFQKWSKYIVFLLSTVTFYQYLRIYPLPIKQIKVFIYVSTIVAFIQVIFDKRFFDFFLYRLATDETRGVSSVFPEPTYYGMYCLMLMVLLQQFKYYRKDLYILLIFNIVLLAQSSQAILFLFVWGIVKSFFAFNKKVKVIVVSLGLLITYFNELIFSRFNSLFDTRFTALLGKLDFADLAQILVLDQSISERVSHIILPIYWSARNFFYPHGYYQWHVNVENYDNELFEFSSIGSGMIMSAFGSVIFEIGMFSFPLIYLFFKLNFKISEDSVIFIVMFSLIFLSSFQLTIPLYALLLAFNIQKVERLRQLL